MRLKLLSVAVILLFPTLSRSQDVADGRSTWFIFLETGKKTPDDKDAVAQMQNGHIANFIKLHAEKKLFAAGPLADPSGKKRGIVVVKAGAQEEISAYFQPDEYVREGYMVLNAERARVHRPLVSEGLDPDGIEEVRIVLVSRPESVRPTTAEREDHAFFAALVERGTVGAWYSLDAGPIAEVLFCRSTDTAALVAAFGLRPSGSAWKTTVSIWPQYLGKGVVK